MQAVRPDMNMYDLLLNFNFVISLKADVMGRDSIQMSGSECQLHKLLQKKSYADGCDNLCLSQHLLLKSNTDIQKIMSLFTAYFRGNLLRHSVP
jgi:hypothetical protein